MAGFRASAAREMVVNILMEAIVVSVMDGSRAHTFLFLNNLSFSVFIFCDVK